MKKHWSLQADRPSEALEELADMFIVAAGMMRWNIFDAIKCIQDTILLAEKNNYKLPELRLAVDYKMKINRGRTWDNNGGKYQHKEKK